MPPSGRPVGGTPLVARDVITLHSKNLLEAFKRKAAEKQPPPSAPTVVRAVQPEVRKPAIDLRPTPARAAETQMRAGTPRPLGPGAQGARLGAGRAGFDLEALARSPLARLGALALVLAAVAFLAGRWSAGSSAVEAQSDATAGSEVESASLAPPAASANANASAPASLAAGLVTEERDLLPEERALRDTRNKYTIQAIQYQNKERFQPLAAATYEYLKSKGLPVCRPVVSGTKIYILIGASPSSGELERELLERVRALAGPDGRKGEFASAYIAPIDHLYQRGGP